MAMFLRCKFILRRVKQVSWRMAWHHVSWQICQGIVWAKIIMSSSTLSSRVLLYCVRCFVTTSTLQVPCAHIARGGPNSCILIACKRRRKVRVKLYKMVILWSLAGWINFLSTNSHPTLVSVKRKQKDGSQVDLPAPQVFSHYAEDINGVDRGDQIRMQYPTCRRSKKYWKYVFWFLFDTVIACSFIRRNPQSPTEI